MKLYTLLSRIFCRLFAVIGSRFLLHVSLFFLDTIRSKQLRLDRRDLILKLFRRGFSLSELATYTLADLEDLEINKPAQIDDDFDLEFDLLDFECELDQVMREIARKGGKQ